MKRSAAKIQSLVSRETAPVSGRFTFRFRKVRVCPFVHLARDMYGRTMAKWLPRKVYSLRFTFGCMVMALGILTSCTAQTTRPMSEVTDRHNFRDEQEGAPRVDNAPIDR